MSDADLALATIAGLESLNLKGGKLSTDVAKILVGATIDRTIDGASTLTLDLYDDDRKLLNSGFLSSRVQVNVDNWNFELVQVRKSGTGLTIVFEDLPVAALRRHNSPLKIAPGTLTHVDFARRLVTEEPWLTFWTPPGLAGSLSKVELARGEPAKAATATAQATEEKKEDSWTALGRLADERGWRRYVVDSETIAYVPETYLVAQTPTYTLEEGQDGVDNLDFDFDSGKPSATVVATVKASRWAIPIGSVVTIEGLGPVNGTWLVSTISRSLFSVFAEVTLTKARPTIPEKAAETSAEITGAVKTTYDSQKSGDVVSVTAPVAGNYGSGATTRGVDQSGDWPDDPTNLVKIGQGNHRLAAPAAESFAAVIAAFGAPIPVTDSYRSVAVQTAAYNSNKSRYGKPGNSAHGEGRAVDVNLAAVGAYPAGGPTEWANNKTWKKLNDAFMSQGWCNYQYHNGTTKGRTSEPWHWSYQVCK